MIVVRLLFIDVYCVFFRRNMLPLFMLQDRQHVEPSQSELQTVGFLFLTVLWLFDLCQSNLRISASSDRAVSFRTSCIFLHGYGSNLVNITLAGKWMCIPPNIAYCLIIVFDASTHIIYIFSISYALPFGKVQTIHVRLVCSSHIKRTGASTCDV